MKKATHLNSAAFFYTPPKALFLNVLRKIILQAKVLVNQKAAHLCGTFYQICREM